MLVCVSVGGTRVKVGVCVSVGVWNGVNVNEGVKEGVADWVAVTVPVAGRRVGVPACGVVVIVGVKVIVGVFVGRVR